MAPDQKPDPTSRANLVLSIFTAVAFAIQPVLLLYGDNVHLTPLLVILRPILVPAGIVTAILLATRLWRGDVGRAAVVLSVFFAVLLPYGLVARYFHILAPLWFAALWVTVALLVAWAAARAKPITRHSIAMVLGMMAVVFLVMPIGSVAAAHVPSDRARWVESLQIHEPQTSSPLPASLPDIFYIVMDGFGRTDILREMYGVDDGSLRAALASRGFYVAERARSNYAQTLLSLASSLNMTYLAKLSPMMADSASKLPLRHVIHHNRVARILKEAGYRTIFVGSDYTPLSTDAVADECRCGTFGFTEFEALLLGRTPFWIPPFEQVRFVGHRRQILTALDHIAQVEPADVPQFVFAHIFSPHPPFVFDKNGRPVVGYPRFAFADGSHFPATRADYVAGYSQQVQFMGAEMLRVVDAILGRRKGRDTVIVVQGDHGPGSMVDWESAERTNVRERLGILLAYRLPGGPAGLYPSITPVNSFRLILARYLGRPFDGLKDESYFSTWSKPYEFIRAPAEIANTTSTHSGDIDP